MHLIRVSLRPSETAPSVCLSIRPIGSTILPSRLSICRSESSAIAQYSRCISMIARTTRLQNGVVVRFVIFLEFFPYVFNTSALLYRTANRALLLSIPEHHFTTLHEEKLGCVPNPLRQLLYTVGINGHHTRQRYSCDFKPGSVPKCSSQPIKSLTESSKRSERVISAAYGGLPRVAVVIGPRKKKRNIDARRCANCS